MWAFVERNVNMADEPFYSPTRKPPPPRKPQPGEWLWVLVKDNATWSCELRDQGEWSVEAQILLNGELTIGHRFDTKAIAVKWAEFKRAELEKKGGA